MTIARLPDWHARLLQYIVDSAARPFDEVTHNCATFAAGGVRAQTEVDLAAKYLGFKTLGGGLKRLKRAGFADHVAFVDAHFERRPVPMARPGDLALVDTDDGPALSIVQGALCYVVTRAGLDLTPLLSAQTAWSVG